MQVPRLHKETSLFSATKRISTTLQMLADSITSLVSAEETYTDPEGRTTVNRMASMVRQNAEQILMRVEKSGVISSINQTAETIKIAASKVDIEGAALFTSGKLSKVVLVATDEWYSSTSSTTPTGGTWTSDQPTLAAGRHTWHRQRVTYSDGTTEYSPSETGTCVTQQTDLSGVRADGIASSVQLWYTKSGSTAPAKPTSQVTSTSNAGGAWRLSVPTYDSAYPYYFYCFQQKHADGHYSWTDVVYDNATTELQSTARATSKSLADYVTSNDRALDSLKSQVDEKVEVWYYAADPTGSNAPARDWTSQAAKAEHLGDLYYNTSSGRVWRWALTGTSTYGWSPITDKDAQDALRAAQDAQATADGKRRIFTATPTVPYDVGDLWVNGSVVRYAKTARATGAYSSSDWALTATDDTAANAAQATADKNVKSSTQLWYTKADNAAPAAPTSRVTSTATSGGAWRTVVPTYSASYPHYFYCWQYQLADGTYAWSPVIYDRATTEAQEKAAKGVTDAQAAQVTANGAIARQQLIYRNARSGTNSVSGMTTWLEPSTLNVQNAWTTKRPPYSSTYPVLFVATQSQTVAQMNAGSACSCTTPVKDDTTTVIDGGHITTGTIDAARIAANSITSDKIAAGAITTDQLAAGAITADMISGGTMQGVNIIQDDGLNKVDQRNGNFYFYRRNNTSEAWSYVGLIQPYKSSAGEMLRLYSKNSIYLDANLGSGQILEEGHVVAGGRNAYSGTLKINYCSDNDTETSMTLTFANGRLVRIRGDSDSITPSSYN